MPTECNPSLFEFARVEGRAVVASFDGGRMTSDAGAVLLGAADRVIGLTRRLAGCFTDARNPAFIEHEVETLVMQRVVGIALGYEDLIDMTNCATIRCWRHWRVSSPRDAATVRRWRANRR